MKLQLYNPIQQHHLYNYVRNDISHPSHQLIHAARVTQKQQWNQMKEWKTRQWNQMKEWKTRQWNQMQQHQEDARQEMVREEHARQEMVREEHARQEHARQEMMRQETVREETVREQYKLCKISVSLNENWLTLCVNITCNIIYALSTTNVYKYKWSNMDTDNGSWSNQFTEEYVSFSNISCNPSGKKIIVSGIKRVKRDNAIVERTTVIYYSNDYAATWTLIYSNNNNNSTSNVNDYIISVKCTSKPSFIVLSLNGCVYEYDKSWKQLMHVNSWCSSIVSNYPNKLLIISSGYMNGGVYISYDYGLTLVKQSTLNFNVLVSSIDSKYISAICNAKPTQGIYISGDYGNSWNKTLSVNVMLTSIHCNNSGKFIVATSNTCMYTSNNYGMTWLTYETDIHDWNSSTVNEDGTLIIGTTLNYATNISNVYFITNF